MKISCSMIIRDEASTLRACLDSIRPYVDELVLVDTGSQDDSPAICRSYADTFAVWTGCNDPATGHITDFSAARNHALSLATGDALCWFDGDDVVRGVEHLRKLASEAASALPGAAWSHIAKYEYERDAAGRVVTLQWRERLVYPRTMWEWRGPVHEGLLGKAGIGHVNHVQTEAFWVEHQIQKSKKPRDKQRNLRILEKWVAAHGIGAVREWHYLGAELMYNGRIGEAMHWFRKHARTSDWSDERMLSLLHLARICLAMGDFSEAIEWGAKAIANKSWPEPYWVIGQASCALAEAGWDADYNFRRGIWFLQEGFRLDTPAAASLLMKNPTARGDAQRHLAAAYERVGLHGNALEMAEQAMATNPGDTELAASVGRMKRARLSAQVAELEASGAIKRHEAAIIGATLKGEYQIERRAKAEPKPKPVVQVYLDGARSYAEKYPERMVACGMPWFPGIEKLHVPKLRIAFWLGHQLEPWTPETLMRDGMGGSETMAWEMSSRLAKMGHHVVVFGHTPSGKDLGRKGVDEPIWCDASQFTEQGHGHWDVLIVSRQAGAVQLPHTATARVLWVHDVHVGPELTPQVAIHYDLIWCLSQWHKQFFQSVYPWLPPGKVEVTRNGIDVARFGAKVERRPHRAIYSSSPDRGLAEAVAAWPEVRRAIPDAELHCYYGFDNWDRTLELNGDSPGTPCSRAARDALKAAIASTEGVVMHGRVNQQQLAEAMLGAGVWFYPTWFSETSCITAMEAQAAGLVCVCPPIAALAETVINPQWSEDVAHAAITALLDLPTLVDVPLVRHLASDRFSLDTLALDWEKRLTALVEQQRANVVPEFKEAAQ